MAGPAGKKTFMLAIMEGRRFATYDDITYVETHDLIIHWDGNYGQSPVREGKRQWGFRGFSKLHEIVEQQWYEDPDMIGKPMKTKRHITDSWSNDIFVGRLKDRYVGYFDSYPYAEPLTAADLYQGEV